MWLAEANNEWLPLHAQLPMMMLQMAAVLHLL
jgi:hypothetical protein